MKRRRLKVQLKPEKSNTLNRSLHNVTLLMPCECLANQGYDSALSMRFAVKKRLNQCLKCIAVQQMTYGRARQPNDEQGGPDQILLTYTEK